MEEPVPKVSVVIPVYAVEPWLGACLDSVLGQTHRDLEVICIDDASPDRCGEILDAYAARDARVQVIHLGENRRQGYGRNRGMERATGKYIYFLDSDDMITSDAIERLTETAEKDALDGIFFDSDVVYDEPEMARRYASYITLRRGEYPSGVVTGEALFERFIEQEEWTCYVQRQFWNLDFLRREGVAFPEGVEHEDELFAFEGILLAGRVRYLREAYFIRRYRASSVMTTPPTAKNFHGYFMNFWRMACFLRQRGIHSRAAERNVARVCEKAKHCYDKLAVREGTDIGAWFRPEERELLSFFETMQASSLYYEDLRAGLEPALRQAKRLFIYGTGVIARRAYRTLEQNGFIIEAFVVTSRKGNPEVLHGRPVWLRDALIRKEGDLMLLAMSRGYEDEVQPELEGKGWKCLSFLE